MRIDKVGVDPAIASRVDDHVDIAITTVGPKLPLDLLDVDLQAAPRSRSARSRSQTSQKGTPSSAACVRVAA